jgi:hypothetical protein
MIITEAQRIRELMVLYKESGFNDMEALAQASKDILFCSGKNNLDYSMMCIARVLIGFALIMVLYYDFFIPHLANPFLAVILSKDIGIEMLNKTNDKETFS